MPPVLSPAEQWLANQIAGMRADIAALKAGQTQFVVDPSTSKTQAIVGNLAQDASGNATGQSGWGVASFQAKNNGWTAPTLLNSWANQGGTAETVGYLKDPLGFAHVKGIIKSGASGTVAFTLPVGYRPGGDCYFATGNGNGLPSSNPVLVTITAASGNVTVFWGGTGTLIALSGITFLVEN